MTAPLGVFIGPDKCGSTWLHQYFMAHPGVACCTSKEVFFFDTDAFDRGKDWYAAHFQQHSPVDARVEVCHEYLFSPLAAERLSRFDAAAIAMVGVRRPIERAVSSYQYMRLQGRTDLDFSTALRTIDELTEHGAYKTNLAPFVEHLGEERVLLLDFDLLRADANEYAATACAALGIAPIDPDGLLGGDRVLPASASRSPSVTRALRSAGAHVRRLGGHRLATTVKSNRVVKRTLFRPLRDDERIQPSPEDHEFVRHRLAEDFVWLDETFGSRYVKRWFDGGDVS